MLVIYSRQIVNFVSETRLEAVIDHTKQPSVEREIIRRVGWRELLNPGIGTSAYVTTACNSIPPLSFGLFELKCSDKQIFLFT